MLQNIGEDRIMWWNDNAALFAQIRRIHLKTSLLKQSKSRVNAGLFGFVLL